MFKILTITSKILDYYLNNIILLKTSIEYTLNIFSLNVLNF